MGIRLAKLLLLVLRASSVFLFRRIGCTELRILKFALFYALYFILRPSFFEKFLLHRYTLYTGCNRVLDSGRPP